VIFSINPSQVVEQHIKWNGNYIDNFIRPVSRGVIRDAVSQFSIEEVYSTERFALSELIRIAMDKSLAEDGLILHEFVLRNIAFSDQYADSLEQKQLAELLAQQAAFVVEQHEQEAEQARRVAQEERINSIERGPSGLQTLACLALPVTFLAVGISRARRRKIIPESGVTAAEHKTQANNGEKALETKALIASSPEEYYFLGKSFLERDERSKAIEAFTKAYRTSKDPIMKKEALNQLELLDAVKKL
jgi:regulator of protease activity HflC (stomatin/prohibitin superfamily)